MFLDKQNIIQQPYLLYHQLRHVKIILNHFPNQWCSLASACNSSPKHFRRSLKGWVLSFFFIFCFRGVLIWFKDINLYKTEYEMFIPSFSINFSLKWVKLKPIYLVLYKFIIFSQICGFVLLWAILPREWWANDWLFCGS